MFPVIHQTSRPSSHTQLSPLLGRAHEGWADCYLGEILCPMLRIFSLPPRPQRFIFYSLYRCGRAFASSHPTCAVSLSVLRGFVSCPYPPKLGTRTPGSFAHWVGATVLSPAPLSPSLPAAPPNSQESSVPSFLLALPRCWDWSQVPGTTIDPGRKLGGAGGVIRRRVLTQTPPHPQSPGNSRCGGPGTYLPPTPD